MSGAAPMDRVAALAAALPALWKDRERFVVLDDRFDGGARFQLIRDIWRSDPDRCAQLHVITASSDIAAGPTAQPLAEELVDVWPPITPNLHRLAFDGGSVQWLLMPMPLRSALRELLAEVDVFVSRAMATVDAHGARRQAKALARLACTGSTVWFDADADAGAASEDDITTQAMRSAGFRPLSPPLSPEGRRSTPWPRNGRWQYSPQFTPRHAHSRTGSSPASSDPILIVGAGLAGCAMAWALAEQGRNSVVFERHDALAMETSGNPAGLFHGIVNPQDGAHARFNRAAALEAQRAVSIALAQHGVPGSASGLLRLETAHNGDDTLHRMQCTLAGLHLPPNYVQALSTADASARSGLRLPHPAWWYPGGGWVQPGGLARSFLERAGGRASLRTNCAVDSLQRGPLGWALHGARGELLAQSGVVVLANAGDALRLLRPWASASHGTASEQKLWPLRKVRGQISVARIRDLGGLTLPRVPITGAGYLLPNVDGLAVFGATSQTDDEDPSVRNSDQRDNLAQLSRLTGVALRVGPGDIGGRTGWRWSTDDRLPVLGAVPDVVSASTIDRLEQAPQVPRLEGLYACTAFGSRGITWAALASQVVAASITGAPMPIEAGLLDCVDAARFVVRRAARR